MKQCHKHCKICHQRRIKITVKDGVCNRCSQEKHEHKFNNNNKALPTWSKNGIIYYHIPKELQNLTFAEKLLIQRVSPLIPVIHIKNGILGLRGHIVSFHQDISNITNILPRLPSEIKIVKVIRSSTTKSGNTMINAFKVNKTRVLNALYWLKNNNYLYRDINIEKKIYHGLEDKMKHI